MILTLYFIVAFLFLITSFFVETRYDYGEVWEGIYAGREIEVLFGLVTLLSLVWPLFTLIAIVAYPHWRFRRDLINIEVEYDSD